MKSYSSIQTTVPRTDGTGMDKSRSHKLHHISKNVVCKHIFNVVQLSVVSYVYIYIYLCVYPELIKYIVYTSSKIVYCLIIKSVLIQTYRQYSPSISSIIYIYIYIYHINTLFWYWKSSTLTLSLIDKQTVFFCNKCLSLSLGEL